MANETIEITDQEIQKALDILNGITAPAVDDTIEKAKKEAEGKKEPIDNKEEEEAEKKLAEKKANFEKSMGELKGIKKGFKDTYKAKKDELKKAFPDEWKEKKESKSKEKAEKKHDEPFIKKGEEGTALLSVTQDPIVKAMSDQIGALNILVQDQRKQNDEIKKSLEAIGNQSQGVRSLKNIHAIEKSFQDEINKGVKIMSISQNKDLISRTLLDLSNIEKGEANDFYTSATLLFDTSHAIEQSTLTDLYTNHKIKIVD